MLILIGVKCVGFPLDFNDLTLLSAIVAAILLSTSEFINPRHSRINFVLNRARFSSVGFFVSYIFVFLIIIRLYQLILSF